MQNKNKGTDKSPNLSLDKGVQSNDGTKMLPEVSAQKFNVNWNAIGAVVAIMALVLSVWLPYISGLLFRPSIEVGFGFIKASSGDLRKDGLRKDGPVTYLVFTTERPVVNTSLFMVPFYIKNQSTRALTNIIIRLTYPTDAVFNSTSVRITGTNHELKIDPEYAKIRSIVNTIGSTTSEFHIDILRPGEGYGVIDILRLGQSSVKLEKTVKDVDIRQLNFPERLQESLDLRDVLSLNAFVAAAEAGPYTAPLTIVWAVGEEGTDRMVAVAERIANAAWGPYRPEPGISLKWPWQPSKSSTTYFELVHTNLLKGKDYLDQDILVQPLPFSPDAKISMTAYSTSMPNWDYYGIISR